MARLADYLRSHVKGVGGFIGAVLNDAVQAERVKDVSESDQSLYRALNTQKKIIELHRLVCHAPEYGIKFLWVSYTFWGEEFDYKRIGHFPVEQNIRLVVATDTDRQAVAALVHTGTSPYADDPDPDAPKNKTTS